MSSKAGKTVEVEEEERLILKEGPRRSKELLEEEKNE